MLIKRATKTKGVPKRASVPLIANQGGSRSGGQLWSRLAGTEWGSMCRNLSHRELLNMSHTVSASVARCCCPHPAPPRRCLGTARLRHACARHFNVQSAAPTSTTSRAEHAHFLPRLNGSKTLFWDLLYCIIARTLFYLLRRTPSTAHHRSAAPCSEINWKAIKTLVYLLLRFFSRICCMYFVKYFNIFCCSPHCTKLPKWQKRFCSAQPNGFEFGWGIGLSARQCWVLVRFLICWPTEWSPSIRMYAIYRIVYSIG